MKHLSAGILIASSFLLMMKGYTEIFTWEDEHGRVHYGDSVPEKYKTSAAQVENPHINVLAPTEDIRKLNSEAVAALRKRDEEIEKQRSKLEAERQIEAYQEATPIGVPATGQSKFVTREDCRNIYNQIRERMRCYQVADATRKHFIEHHGLSPPPKHKTH